MISRTRVATISVASLLSLLAITLVASAAWIFYTPSGLSWLSARLSGFAGEGLTLEGVSGTLANGANITSIEYSGPDIGIRVREASLTISTLSMLTLTPRISALRATQVEVITRPGEPRGRPPDTIALPVNLSLDTAHIAQLVVDAGEGPIDISNVRLVGYHGGKSRHSVRDLSFSTLDFAVALRGSIDAQSPFNLAASVAAVGVEKPDLSASARIGGTLSEITLEGDAHAAEGRVSGTATLTPYANLPLSAIALMGTNIDLYNVNASLPRTALSGQLKLDLTNGTLQGPLELTNAIPGPYDEDRLPLASVRAIIDSNLRTAGFTSLSADLGRAGIIAGSGSTDRNVVRLTLQTERLDLNALHTRMRATHLAGRAEIELQPARQSVVAQLAQDDLALELTAHRAGDVVEIPTFRARARGGVAKGEANINLAGEQPFSVKGRLERFNPAAWGDFPPGSVNATASAVGKLETLAAEVRFTTERSRLLGAPLAGAGRIHVTPDRLHQANVNVTLGDNRLSATGAFGRPGDTLDVRFNASNLALIDRQLRGMLNGTATIGGSFRTPRVRFDARGSTLSYRGYGSIGGLHAAGEVDVEPNGTLAVRASFIDVATDLLRLRSARLDLDGSSSNHSVVVQATGDRIDFRARVRGANIAREGWSGTVLELVNRGDASIELTAPVALRVATARVHVEPFELRALGGRLSIAAVEYSDGRITTAGEMENLPVVPFLSLLDQQKHVGGNLRLSGSWNLRSAPHLTGTVTLVRAAGDLILGKERGFALQLQELAVTANLAPSAITFEARIRSALATVAAAGSVGAVAAAAIPYNSISPLTVSVQADIARLAPFAAFIDTTMLLGGEATARIQVGGTLGKPDVTGRITGQNLTLALPAEGMSLTDGSLVATLTTSEIQLESFSIRGGQGVLRARGTLARETFDTVSVDWRTERFMPLARPDRRIVVTGQGNAALKQGKLSITGKLRANEGEFEIAGSEPLPTLSNDVVVNGRSPNALKPGGDTPRRFNGLVLDLNIDLGDQVHITGHGLSVWLAGDLRVLTDAQGEIRASGTVNARNGTFVAYGQRLEIDRGRLLFNGAIADPALDILAMRKRQAVEVGVAVTGTLRAPLVRIVSEPPLPQGEALAWLMLGRPASEAGPGELAALPLATGLLARKLSNPVAQRLRLDELGVGGGAGGQFITLGKRITDRLYFVFQQGLGAAESLLRLEYTLTRRVLLRLQAGEPTSAGIVYRRTWDCGPQTACNPSSAK